MVERYVEQISIKAGMSISQLLEAMGRSGVLGAGNLGRALDVTLEMFSSLNYTVFLTLAGPMVPGGLRRIVRILIDRGLVNAIVASGANLVHDIIEALGYRGVQGSFAVDDARLRAKNIGRAGDIYFPHDGFEALEKKTYEVLDRIRVRRDSLSVSEFLVEYGAFLQDEDSILKASVTKKIPVFCPAILDSMLGLHMWTYSQLHPIQIDPVRDMTGLADMIYNSKKVGALILGGGTSKHFLLGASTLREGLDAAVQITLDRPEAGSQGGAPLEEAVSWKKAKTKSRLVTVIGDATLIFPVLIAAVLEKLEAGRQ